MMKRTSQYESGTQSLDGMTENRRFEMKVSSRIASRFFWLWEWQHALHNLYTHSTLKALVNGWSGTRALPALAYVRVEDVTYRWYAGR